MTSRAASLLAWALWALGLAGLVAGFVLSVANGSRLDRSELSQATAFLAIGTTGLVVARRRPQNPLGWIYLGVWAGTGVLFSLFSEYARWATVTHPGAPFGTFAVWLGNWIWVLIATPLVTFTFLLFPDGHLPTPRWRPVALSVAVFTVLWSVVVALEGHDFTDALGHPAPNPYTPSGVVAFFDAARLVFGVAFVAVIGACVASLVVRFRRGSREEREQIKWLMFAGVVMTVWFALPFEHGGAARSMPSRASCSL